MLKMARCTKFSENKFYHLVDLRRKCSTIVSVLIIMSACLILSVTAAYSSDMYFKITNQQLLESYKTIPDSSNFKCGYICTSDKNCNAFNHQASTQTCELVNKSSENHSNTSLNSTGWTSYVKDCGEPTPEAYSIVLPGSTYLDSERTFECVTGYLTTSPASELKIKCTASGQWSAFSYTCLKDCGEPTPEANSIVLPGSTYLDSERTFECVTGYLTTSPASELKIKCTASGQWSAFSYTCLKDCGEPTPEANSIVLPGSTYLYSKRTFECVTGYLTTSPASELKIKCTASGQWSAFSYTCLKDCGEPTPEANSIVLPGSTYLDSERTFECVTGYITTSPASELKIKCTASGQWSAFSYTCLKDCGPVSTAVDNGAFNPVGGITTYGGTASLSCTSPCVITGNGSTSLTCDASGSWAAATTPATCDPVESQWCIDHNWVIEGCSCYLFVTNETKNWNDAVTHCAGLRSGAHLVSVETVAENNYLKAMAKTSLSSAEGFFIYGTDSTTEGKFVWENTQLQFFGSGTSTGVLNDFETGQPNDLDGQDCVIMYKSFDYRWQDRDCTAVSAHFICEKDG